MQPIKPLLSVQNQHDMHPLEIHVVGFDAFGALGLHI